MATSNRINKVAIVGAGGNSGRFMTAALLRSGRHTVTAITRTDSETALTEGVVVRKIDYDHQQTIVDALKGQDALVITISGAAKIQEVEEKLIRAAAEAGVPWILPNEWSPDSGNEEIVNDVPLFRMKVGTRELIEKLGKNSYIAVVTGFWYEWSLGKPMNYGIDFNNRKVTLFDDGGTKICTSTWPQIGRAVAALLSLPIEREGSNEACLQDLKNQIVYINSFNVSQNDMLESAFRVTGTNRSDWNITKEPSHERFATGAKEIQEGKMQGFAKVLYTRIFFPDGCGDFESRKGTLNSALGLPKEDIDEFTKISIERQVTAS